MLRSDLNSWKSKLVDKFEINIKTGTKNMLQISSSNHHCHLFQTFFQFIFPLSIFNLTLFQLHLDVCQLKIFLFVYLNLTSSGTLWPLNSIVGALDKGEESQIPLVSHVIKVHLTFLIVKIVTHLLYCHH